MRRSQNRQKDPIAEHESLLLEAINAGKKEYLLLYARYFAGAKEPRQITMTDLDSMGFTLSYLEKERQSSEGEDSADTQVLEKKEIRIQFDSPISHLNHIEPKLFLMAKEAVQALDKSAVDGAYVAPGVKVKPSFYMAPRSVLITASLLWSSLLYFGFLAPHFGILKSTAVVPDYLALNILFVVSVIHAAEMVALVSVCLWSQMPLGLALQYGLLTFFGGLPAFKEGMRGCFHFRRKLEAQEAIKIR